MDARPASAYAARFRLAVGLLAAAVLAAVVVRVTGSARAPLWLGPTVGHWVARLLVVGLALAAVTGVHWWQDRQSERSRARALGRDA